MAARRFPEDRMGSYQRYAGREGNDIKRELETMARAHFRAGLDTLVY